MGLPLEAGGKRSAQMPGLSREELLERVKPSESKKKKRKLPDALKDVPKYEGGIKP